MLDLPGDTLLHRGQCANGGLCVTCTIFRRIMTATVMKKMKMLIRIMMMVITDMCRDDNDNSLLCENASRAFRDLQSS